MCSNGATDTAATSSSSADDDYLHQLECLNTSVAEWISQHVQRNPLVDLTPIFRDYEAYLNSLDQKRKQHATDTKPIAMPTLPVIETVKTDVTFSQSIGSSASYVVPSVDKSNDNVIPSVSNSSDHVIPTATSTTGMMYIINSYRDCIISRGHFTRQWR